MREIKFRAWVGPMDEKSMSKPFSVFQGESVLNPFYGEPLMQFTGLLDNSGKEIYEGDIVQLSHWQPSIYQVGFDRGAFCFFGANDAESAYYNDAKYLEGCEIIGNVYESPELLK